MSSSNNSSVSNVILEHVWVEAAIDYIPSGGRHMSEADTWVALDASISHLIHHPSVARALQPRHLAAPRDGRVVNKAGQDQMDDRR